MCKDSPSPELVGVLFCAHIRLHLSGDPRQQNSYRKYGSDGIRGTGWMKAMRSSKVSEGFQLTPVASDRGSTRDKKARKGGGCIGKSGRPGSDNWPDQHYQTLSKGLERGP